MTFSAKSFKHDRAIAELLIAKGANVNHRYEAGFSPLLVAAEKGDIEVAKLLIAHGADVNARTSNAETPLSLALEQGHHEMVTLLRKHGDASKSVRRFLEHFI